MSKHSQPGNRWWVWRVAGALLFVLCGDVVAQQGQCPPTAEDEMGPFYRPGAPYRTSVGQGYLLIGTVRSTVDCTPLPAALIELWMTGPDGQYGDAWRASLFTGRDGRYHFESPPPTAFGSRRPHIHMRISAEGYQPLVTQHYPQAGSGLGQFDINLVPRNPPEASVR